MPEICITTALITDPETDKTSDHNSHRSFQQPWLLEIMSTYRAQCAGAAQGGEAGSVVVKVHYKYTVALSVPLDTPYDELKEQIAQKLGQPASQLRLRHKQHGSRALIPLGGEVEPGRTVQEVAEAGRATLWCQTEDPLANRTIHYQMVALYDYTAQGPEDLEFSEGDTIDILGEVNEEWLEGHCAGSIGIFPPTGRTPTSTRACYSYRHVTVQASLINQFVNGCCLQPKNNQTTPL
ncbi:neutrophil cytosol factor 2-like [Morone saxatilis]|uniref:neutrophil cytosol factor 2-like n=1 Tax=Morone saxatilis TaxID=34816 RepID=UPI0015E212E2|nr:neutrophil cytosol factor 2-like [Morone saxatilis]